MSRRAVIASALALAGCGDRAQGQTAASAGLPALKRTAPFPVGCCAMTGQFADAAFQSLFLAQYGQMTPEWEMKMKSILKDDGSFDFSRADACADFARARGMRLHGHTLIWYSQGGPAFQRVDGQRAAFQYAYQSYIQAVAGRYRGRVVSWDVVNEAVADEGGYRTCLWSKNLGMDYVAEAFRIAHAADPGAVLFLNDYNLESNPAKRRDFLRLAETVLKAGAPLQGLGTQTHLDVDQKPGMTTAAIRDLASLGLPIHVSELDVSTRVKGLSSMPARLDVQARLVGETVEAFMALPARQRFAITVWGLRDKDSWLRRTPNARDGSDRPVLFDDAGRPKPAALRFEQAVTRARPTA